MNQECLIYLNQADDFLQESIMIIEYKTFKPFSV